MIPVDAADHTAVYQACRSATAHSGTGSMLHQRSASRLRARIQIAQNFLSCPGWANRPGFGPGCARLGSQQMRRSSLSVLDPSLQNHCFWFSCRAACVNSDSIVRATLTITLPININNSQDHLRSMIEILVESCSPTACCSCRDSSCIKSVRNSPCNACSFLVEKQVAGTALAGTVRSAGESLHATRKYRIIVRIRPS
jgi:hypothetical protein